jgi:hypothetical protein
MTMALSQAKDFYDSKSFAGYQKHQEARGKLAVATLARFDGVMKGINGVCKMLGAIARGR